MSAGDGTVLGTTKIVDNGPPSQRWNIAIMGDGYTAAQLGQYALDAQTIANTILATAPFDSLRKAINIFRIDVSSTDSGAADPVACGGSGAAPRTYFDSKFCGDGQIRRLLVTDDQTALTTAAAQVPQYHLAIVVVNSTVYGGSGGQVAVLSLAPGAPEIALHEIGHSAFGLADEYEYWAGCGVDAPGTHDHHPPGEPAQPNVTLDANRATNKWRALVLGTTAMPTTANANCAQCDPQPSPVPAGTIGTFEGAHYYHCGAYRPSFHCRMRALNFPFCGVCQDVIRRTLAPFVPALPALAFIKTANTPKAHVEVHLASGVSDYQQRILETATTFANESDGTWQLLANLDLAFIKTSNTPNGHVEVHIASHASNYQQRILETATTFANESDGTWQLLPNQDLAFIKTGKTPKGRVEVHIASRASNYRKRTLETATTFASESDGTWQLLPNLDLAFIKTSNTPNGHVEVHVASRASNYQQRILETATTFANETDGAWALVGP
jgi:hypothetical protein